MLDGNLCGNKIHALYWLIYNILLFGRYDRRYCSRINKGVACVRRNRGLGVPFIVDARHVTLHVYPTLYNPLYKFQCTIA